MRKSALTLDLGHRAGEDILLGLGVVEALEDAVDDALDEVGLLALLGLLLEADPAVEDGLDLARERDLLALDERLGLQLRGLLHAGIRTPLDGRGRGDDAARVFLGDTAYGGGREQMGEKRTLESAKRP